MNLSNKFKEIFQTNLNAAKNRGQSMVAELTTSSTKGILILNPAARKLLQLGIKDRVLIFDIMNEASSIQDRFYLTKGFSYGNKFYGNKLGANGNFMDAAFYNLLLKNDFKAEFCNTDDLIKSGLLFYRNTAKRNDVLTPTHKVSGELSLYTETLADGSTQELFTIVEGVLPQRIFKLSNLQWSVNPHSNSDE